MIPEFKAKSDPVEIKKENSGNEWLAHLETGKEVPLAVEKPKRKRPLKISAKQQKAVRRKPYGD